MAIKRKSKSDDEDEDQAKSKQTTANEWNKFKDNLKKAKNKAHDNYDASKFVSQYRKPLASVSTNSTSTTNPHTSASTSAHSAGSSSHVCLRFFHEKYFNNC